MRRAPELRAGPEGMAVTRFGVHVYHLVSPSLFRDDRGWILVTYGDVRAHRVPDQPLTMHLEGHSLSDQQRGLERRKLTAGIAG